MSYYFDEKEASRAVAFFERVLRHVKGRHAGEPFTLMDWQREIVRQLWGWRREDGTRRYRTLFLAVPRKNGKSTFAAGLALLLLAGDREVGAEVYSAAADREQARIVFDTARRMVEVSALSDICEVYRNAVVIPETGSTYKVLSADAYTKHGLNAHGVIFDELHAQPNRELWDVLTTSTGARAQPLVVAITTAGYDRESICFEIWDYARQVRDGIVRDDTLLPVIYEASEDDDWRDPGVWARVNPGLGQTLLREYLEQEARKAEHMPAYQNTFRRLHLNQWVQQSSRWIDMHLWDEQAGDPIREEDLLELPCWGGLDLSSVSDITAWVLIFAHPDRRDEIHVLPRFWVPEARLHDMSNRYASQYQAWARQGLLEVVPGDVIDYEVVKRCVLEDVRRFRFVSGNVDRLFQGYQVVLELQREGVALYPFGMGFVSMAAPMREFERLLRCRGIHHGGHPVLRWMADNVAVKQDAAGNLKPDKANSQGKIDGIVALVMAIDRWMRGGEVQSVYETRGLLTI